MTSDRDLVMCPSLPAVKVFYHLLYELFCDILIINELIFCIDLQNVNITLRILFRPIPKELPKLYSSLGEDYDERVLPSITNEILKAVVVCTQLFYPLITYLNKY